MNGLEFYNIITEVKYKSIISLDLQQYGLMFPFTEYIFEEPWP